MVDFTCLSRFRLAACLLIALSDCDWEPDLEKTLNNLPNDLFGIYNRFLEQVTSEHWVYIDGIFRWLVFSVTPMTLDELADAIAFDFSDPAKYVYCPDRREGNKRTITKRLEGLVVVKHDKWGKSSVALAHASVQDYVLSEKFMAKFGRDLSAGLSHTFIARTCIHYLLHFADHPLNPETFPSYPLSLYAARNWFYHLQHCHDRTALSTLTVLLLEGDGRQYAALNCLHDFRWSFEDSPNWLRPIPFPLYMCSHIGYTEGVQLLLDNGADPNATGEIFDGNALQAASEKGHTEIVRFLLKNGAHVNAAGSATSHYNTALESASYGGHWEIVCLLLENGADFGRALAAAAEGGDTKTVRVLLENLVNRESGDFGGALQAASREARMEIIHLLLENGADINALWRDDGTALQVASNRGHVDIVRLLLEKGAATNVCGPYGTALQVASEGGHVDTIRLLLEKGAAINMGGPYGTALGTVCRIGRTEIVRLLLQNGADPNAAGGISSTPLSVAARGGHLTIVEILIEKGANIDTNTLWCASYYGHSDIVRLLLEKGVNANPADGDALYRSALETASYGGHLETVRLLLEKCGNFGSAWRSACRGGTWTLSGFCTSMAPTSMRRKKKTAVHCRSHLRKATQK
jgi:ankyrin repeat protein